MNSDFSLISLLTFDTNITDKHKQYNFKNQYFQKW